MMSAALFGSVGPVQATGPIQSSVSAFINCPSSLSFAGPSASGSCTTSDYSGVYNGIAQTVGSTQNTVFYLAVANGGVKVNYSLTDTTSGKVLLRWVGYGSISGGTCSSPSVIVPFTPTSGSSSYVIFSGTVINPGDTIKAHLSIAFTGTGTPTICSGGSSATLISIATTVLAGSSQLILTADLRAGVAHQTTLAGYPGEAVTYVNTGNVTLTAQVLGVLKDSGGRTIDVLATSIMAAPNANVTAFLVFNQYSAGSYTLILFATTSQHVPASLEVMATVSV
jgi:hypothetical protein